MNAALCLRCATLKDGPWAACPECAFTPSEPDDLATAMVLSEEQHNREVLLEMQGRHRRGEPWNFNPVMVDNCKRLLESMGTLPACESSSEKTPKELLSRSGNPGDFFMDRVLLPVALIGIPLLPLESVGRATVKLVTLGWASCREETAWMIGLFAYLLFLGGIVMLLAMMTGRSFA